MKHATKQGYLVSLFALFVGCNPTTVSLDLVGTVEKQSLEVAAPISEVIVDIPVRVGQRVEADQVVVQLDSAVANAELAASEAALSAAAAAQSQAEREYQRIAGLQRARVSSSQDLDRARRARDESVALVAERQARVVQARKRLSDLTLRSWGGGTVDELPFEVGERTSAGSVVAVVLGDEQPYVRVWIPSRVAAHVTVGTKARVEVEGLDHVLPGVVEYVGREAEFTPHFALTERESAHLVYESRIRLEDSPPGLRPGLPARVEMNATVRRPAGSETEPPPESAPRASEAPSSPPTTPSETVPEAEGTAPATEPGDP